MEVRNMISFYQTELERTGVSIRLNTDAADVDLSGWDTVLLATGTVAAGDGADIVELMSQGQLPAQDAITVFGETETAMFAALWLAEHGKKVNLISPIEVIGVDTNDMQRDHLTQLLMGYGVTVTTSGDVPQEGDVFMAVRRTASTIAAQYIDDVRVLPIGTRIRQGRMYEATQSGFWAAARIGESL
jgi:2,4-dienoyl-CoA reductase (NADPH2)